MYRARTLSPVHQPVDYDGPLRTAEEDVRQWRQYIGRLQGKLVPGEQQRRHDLLVASRAQAVAAIQAQNDWMRLKERTIVERQHDVEGLLEKAKRDRDDAARRISTRQDELREAEKNATRVFKRDAFASILGSSTQKRHEKHKRRFFLVRQEIGNVMGEWQYQDDLVAGLEHLLSTLRIVMLSDQEHVYDAPPPTYDAHLDRPPSRHREEPVPHSVPRRTALERPDTTYSIVGIDISDFYDPQGDGLGHHAVPSHYPSSAAPGQVHHAPQHRQSTHATSYDPELEHRPTVTSSGRNSRHSWVPSSPVNMQSAWNWDHVDDEPRQPEPAASPHHPGPRLRPIRSTSPHAAQHHHDQHTRHVDPGHRSAHTRRPAPGDLRIDTTVGGGRPLTPPWESHAWLHASNEAHDFAPMPQIDAINPGAFSPDTAYTARGRR
ncbi:hypothetical protein JCM3775_003483 [Rhodotorula graminis]